MYIKTHNGWVPLWELNKPKAESIPWDILEGKGLDHADRMHNIQKEFEDSQQRKLEAVREARLDRGML